MTIKELRTQEGLSQSEMAKKLGIATSAIGHMENGRMKVSPKIAAKAKEEFGVDLDIEPKASRKPVKEKVKAAEAKVEKAKAARKTKKTVKKADAAEKKSTSKLEIIVQSPMGGNISQCAQTRIGKVEEVLSVGQIVRVKVLNVDPEAKRISLSIRAVLDDEAAAMAEMPVEEYVDAPAEDQE